MLRSPRTRCAPTRSRRSGHGMRHAGGEATDRALPGPPTSALWPLELLLPSAHAQNRFVIGSSRPALFGPLTEAPTLVGAGAQADLVVVAPDRLERRDDGFARMVVSTVAARLA